MSSPTATARLPQARLALCIGPADTYRLERLEADPGVALAAFALTKGGDPLTVKNVGATYHVRQDPAGWSECDCPDATYRQKPCKHLLALHRVGLLPLPPQVRTVEQLVEMIHTTPQPRFRSLGDMARQDPGEYAEQFGQDQNQGGEEEAARELTYASDDYCDLGPDFAA